MSTIDTQLHASVGEKFESLKHTMWAALDNEISLQECDIFR